MKHNSGDGARPAGAYFLSTLRAMEARHHRADAPAPAARRKEDRSAVESKENIWKIGLRSAPTTYLK